MTAQLLMSPAQIAADPGAWLARRIRDPQGRWCVSASEVAMIAGIAPPRWGGPRTLYVKKLMGEFAGDTDEMARGRALEPMVLEEFARDRPDLVLLPGGLYCRREAPWMVATLDGLAVEEDTAALYGIRPYVPRDLSRLPPGDLIVVEAKTSIPTDQWGWQDGSDQIPAHYLAQVLWQAHVLGASRVYVVVKHILSWQPVRWYLIEMNGQEQAQLAWLIERAEKFTAALEAGKPPAPDWFPADTKAIWHQYPGITDTAVRIPWGMAQRYARALAAEKRAQQRRGLVKNQILDRAGEAGTIVARDPRTGKIVKVATRTAGPMPERVMPAIERVERLNPGGWSRRAGEENR